MRAEAWQAIPGVSAWVLTTGKTRLYSSIRSKTTALPQYARHHSTQRGRASPPFRGDESAGKRSHRNRSSSPERVRLLQPLLSRPQNKTAACDLF